MGISKKYIREAFKQSDIQLTREALLMIEEKLKESVKGMVFESGLREFKRVNKLRLNRIFKYEDLIEKG